MEPTIENGRRPELEKFYRDLRTVVEDGENLLKASVETVRGQAKRATEKTDHLVRERPYQAIGFGFGLGVVVGLLLSGLLTRDSSE
jgi:ElaB/YqjD/DUF883 family membrane-anchored ribosome-binding protein